MNYRIKKGKMPETLDYRGAVFRDDLVVDVLNPNSYQIKNKNIAKDKG
jgi:hypothetical protein